MQFSYSRFSLVASAPLLLSACSCDAVAAVIQVGWWGQVSRKSHPPKPHHPLHKGPVALPPGKHHLAHALGYRSTSSHRTAAWWAGKGWHWELQRKTIMQYISYIPLPCLGQSTENTTTLYSKGNKVKWHSNRAGSGCTRIHTLENHRARSKRKFEVFYPFADSFQTHRICKVDSS